MKRTLLVFLAACGGSGSMQHGDDAPPVDASDVDAPDVPPDAPPLLGSACTNQAVEVARIPAAALDPDDRSFYGTGYKQGLWTRDADNDGKADVLVFEHLTSQATGYQYRIRLFPRTATGFAAPVVSTFIVPQYGAEGNFVGDVNGDKLLDVIFTYSTETPQRSPFVYVALQQANKTFTVGARIDVSACNSSMDERLFGFAIVDIDRDGKDDVLTTVSYGGLGAAPAGLTLLRGTTTGLVAGTCIAASGTTTNGIPNALYRAEVFFAGDFDGDGYGDLVASVADKLKLYKSTGASTFTPIGGEVAEPTWRVTYGNVVAGRPQQDLVNADIKSNITNVNRIVIDPTTGLGAAPSTTLPEADTNGSYGNIRGIVVGDLNGDKRTDVLAVGSQGSNTTTRSTFSVTCDRNAKWEQTGGSFGTSSVRDLRGIDYDGDGRTEVLAPTATDAVVYKIQ
jgi:FG-GAP-like repeat